MNHRLLLFGFLCSVLGATNIMFGMKDPQTLSIFYAKDNNNNYFQLDQQGNCKPQNNIAFQLSPHHPNVFLSYDIHTQKYSLKKNLETIANVDTLHTPLIQQLRLLTDRHSLYAKLNNNNEYAHIDFIVSPNIPRSNPLDAIIEEYKKKNNIDIIEREDIDKKISFIPSYRTIAQSLATLALVCIIIKYIHHLPHLCNKILHMHYCQLRSNRTIV